VGREKKRKHMDKVGKISKTEKRKAGEKEPTAPQERLKSCPRTV
jgi:hypothetical protein